MRRALFLVLATLSLFPLWYEPAPRAASSQASPAQTGAVLRHRMTKITETIYRADAAGSPGINSTSWAFVNDRDVLAVDSEGSPASARSLLEGIKSVTDKPVRYLVDSHFHFDHAYGNAGLPADVEIIGHDFARKMLLSQEARTGVTISNFTAPMPARVEALKKDLAAATDPAKRADIAARLALQEETLKVYSGNFPLQPPNLTVSRQMSVWSGAKEFRIMWLGRAHTAGDLYVYVPSERAVATGDTIFKGIVGWQGDAFADEHPATLEALKKLDIELLLPGHGDHIQGRAAIDQAIDSMQAYLREEWQQVAALKKQGLTPDEVLKRVDLGKFTPVYGAQGVAPSLPAVQRIYNVIDGKVIRD
jgi:glyoxylase-like metal-dependent hydrolase (beta-lactamase superfamily II)